MCWGGSFLQDGAVLAHLLLGLVLEGCAGRCLEYLDWGRGEGRGMWRTALAIAKGLGGGIQPLADILQTFESEWFLHGETRGMLLSGKNSLSVE